MDEPDKRVWGWQCSEMKGDLQNEWVRGTLTPAWSNTIFFMWHTCFVLLLGDGAALHRTHFGKHLEEKVGTCHQIILQLVQACLETRVPNLQTVDWYLQSDQWRCEIRNKSAKK